MLALCAPSELAARHLSATRAHGAACQLCARARARNTSVLCALYGPRCLITGTRPIRDTSSPYRPLCTGARVARAGGLPSRPGMASRSTRAMQKSIVAATLHFEKLAACCNAVAPIDFHAQINIFPCHLLMYTCQGLSCVTSYTRAKASGLCERRIAQARLF